MSSLVKGVSPRLAAKNRGVARPFVAALTSAPRAISARADSAFPCWQALCRGVRSPVVLWSTGTPWSARKSIRAAAVQGQGDDGVAHPAQRVVDVRSLRQQELGHRQVALGRRVVQGSLVVLLTGVEVGAPVQQQPRHVHVTLPGGEVQRRQLVGGVALADRDTLVQQERDDVGLAFEAGHVQRGAAPVIPGGEASGIGLRQPLDRGQIALCGRVVNGSGLCNAHTNS
ncbi:MAG: hypothetical protein MUF78_11835, partial [Candidatus Edwardsbacteria bacterium]|nr:hypothetical protein [Candidatus Edwardsbacteria bacterium]